MFNNPNYNLQSHILTQGSEALSKLVLENPHIQFLNVMYVLLHTIPATTIHYVILKNVYLVPIEKNQIHLTDETYMHLMLIFFTKGLLELILNISHHQNSLLNCESHFVKKKTHFLKNNFQKMVNFVAFF